MMTNKELAKAATMQAKKMREKKQEITRRVTATLSTVTCLCLLVGLCFAMPSMVLNNQPTTPIHGGIASLFAGGSVGSYIVVGFIAFLLGITVTIICKTLLIKREGKDGLD